MLKLPDIICRYFARLPYLWRHNTPGPTTCRAQLTQRGVQAYITNLERELTEALRSLETTLDILTDPAKSEYSIGDYTVRLCEEDMQKIAVAVGIPEGFKAGSDSGAAHRSLLSFKQRVSELRTFAAARKRIDRHVIGA